METPKSKSKNLPNIFFSMIDLRQAPEYAHYMRALGWHVVSKQQTVGSWQFFAKKLPILGSIVKIQRPEVAIPPISIDRIATENKAVVAYVEPLNADSWKLYAEAGFLSAKNCFLPAKTIQIDLTKSEKELLSEMKPKTRYNIKVAQKRGVVVEESQDIESFVGLWHSSARRRGMFLSQKKEILALWRAFGPKATLLLAHNSSFIIHNSRPIAGILMLRTDDTACYMYAASTKEGNRLFAPTLLAWEAIKLAKERGCKIFDFEGIFDERYPQTKNWKGFTRFKEGFGGKVITYPGTFVKYYNPIVKLLRL